MATAYSSYVDEYDATCDYDTANDVSKARRFIVAVRGMLRFSSSSSRDGVSMSHDPAILQDQLKAAIAWLAANTDPSDTNPDVVHADFRTFGQYGGGY